MKTSDLLAAFLGAVCAAFFLVPQTRGLYEQAYGAFPLIVTFFKFGLFATLGEAAASRIRSGRYFPPAFGFVSRALIWGFLGLAIYAAFRIFSSGVPALMGPVLPEAGLVSKIAGAFFISLFMNVFFAPVMMLTHHLTDSHIAAGKGRFVLRTFRPLFLLKKADWDKMWGFVFRLTIPLFWIPAHTVTFLLPEQFRTVFAAFLSVALGLFLGLKGQAGKRHNVEN